MTLTLAEANRIVAGAIAQAEELGIRVTVAVCDQSGRLVALSRMDGAFMAADYGAVGKAVASAAFARPSGDLRYAQGPLVPSIIEAHGRGMVPSAGAIPIMRDGVVLGACGVGGASDSEDETCAKAGIARL